MRDEAGLSFFQEAGRRHRPQLLEQARVALFRPLSKDEPWEAQDLLAGLATLSPQRFTCTQVLRWFVTCDLHVASKSTTSSKRGVPWAPSLAKGSAAAAAVALREAAGTSKQSLLATLCKDI